MHTFSLTREYLLSGSSNDMRLMSHLFDPSNQRNHDLKMRLDSVLLYFHRGLKDGARLHLSDLRKDDTKTASTHTEHGINFTQLLYTAQRIAKRQHLRGFWIIDLQSCDLHKQVLQLGQEFMQWRIQQ